MYKKLIVGAIETLVLVLFFNSLATAVIFQYDLEGTGYLLSGETYQKNSVISGQASIDFDTASFTSPLWGASNQKLSYSFTIENFTYTGITSISFDFEDTYATIESVDFYDLTSGVREWWTDSSGTSYEIPLSFGLSTGEGKIGQEWLDYIFSGGIRPESEPPFWFLNEEENILPDGLAFLNGRTYTEPTPVPEMPTIWLFFTGCLIVSSLASKKQPINNKK